AIPWCARNWMPRPDRNQARRVSLKPNSSWRRPCAGCSRTIREQPDNEPGMRILIIGCMALAMLSMTDAAYRYPQDIFISPVNRDIRLSGTFGELRNNHFHAGLDIKSKDGSSGEAVVAVGDGYISRIKVEEFGYGNVLYVNHPNGYTTVYAHLDKFAPEIQAYAKQRQYKEETFEVDIPLEPNVFPVRTAQLIGYLGNTGSSGGPHLHYEIRHTRNQTPINPLHFGYQVTDNLP